MAENLAQRRKDAVTAEMAIIRGSGSTESIREYAFANLAFFAPLR